MNNIVAREKNIRDIVSQNCDSIMKVIGKKYERTLGYYTTEQAADCYGVSTNYITGIITYLKDEFFSDGSETRTITKFKSLYPEANFFPSGKKYLVVFPNGDTYDIFAGRRWYLTPASFVRIGLLTHIPSKASVTVKDMGAKIVKRLLKNTPAKTKKSSKKEIKISKPVSATVTFENAKVQNEQLQIDLRKTRDLLTEATNNLNRMKAANKLLATKLLKKYDAKLFTDVLRFFAHAGNVTSDDLSKMILNSFFDAVKEGA